MRHFWIIALLMVGLVGYIGLSASDIQAMPKSETLMKEKPNMDEQEVELATLAGGCFWCLESEFRSRQGVLFTIVGYTAGHVDNPSYHDVTTGKSGHAEAVEIYYDPKLVSYEELVRYFLEDAHDPTTLNRQGVDVGTQYRSEIFYHDETQKGIAELLIKDIDAKGIHKDSIVTKISPAVKFWEGEEYHQQYYEKYEAENGVPHIRMIYKMRKKQTK